MTPQEEIENAIHKLIMAIPVSAIKESPELQLAMIGASEAISKCKNLSTALSEALALRVENEKLRDALWQAEPLVDGNYQDTLDFQKMSHGENHQCNPEAGCDGSCMDVYYAGKVHSMVDDALHSQPTPTGLTDKLLRLVVDTLRHIKGIEQWSTVQNTASALTPEEINMIEGLVNVRLD